MDAQWNELSTTNLTQIAQALGYGSPNELPPINNITDAQLQIIRDRVGTDAAGKVQQLRVQFGTPDAPVLSQPKVDFGDGSALTLLIASLQSKLKDLQIQTSQQAIKQDKDDLAAKNQENLKKLQDAIDKMKQADKGGLMSKIFGWVGVALAVVAAVAAVIVTGGAAAAVVGLAIAGLAMGIMAMQESGAMDSLMTEMFGDNDKAKFWFQIGLQVALLAAGLATMALTGGASAAGEISNLMRVAQMVQQVARIGGGVAAVAGGAAGIATGVTQYQATQDRADSKSLQAWIAKLQQQLQDEQEQLKKILKQLEDGVGITMDMLKSIDKSKDTIMQFASA